MNTKKIFIAVLILFVLSAAGLAAYNLFFKGGGFLAGPQPSTPANREGSVSQGALKAVSQDKVFGATVGADGQSIKYYLGKNGNVVQSDFEGKNITEISSKILQGLTKIIWSPDKEKVIGFFQENGNTTKNFYDYSSGKYATLAAQIGNVSFSPDSQRIAYQFLSANGEHTIAVADPDGTNWKNIFKTRLDKLIIDWPAKNKISLLTPPSGLAQGLVYSLQPDTGDFQKILSDFYGLVAKWSPKADKLLFSYTDSNGKKPRLAVADEGGAKTKELNLSGLSDKCVWAIDDKTIFCALPQNISAAAVWPDDYYMGRVAVADDIYKIDLENDQRTKIIGSTDTAGFDARELFLSPKEDYLFFVNQRDGLLYSLKLK